MPTIDLRSLIREFEAQINIERKQTRSIFYNVSGSRQIM